MKSLKFVMLKALFIAACTFSAGSFSFSQAQTESYVRAEGNKVQFAGMEDDVLVFDLRFPDLPPKGCYLRILDDKGATIFEEQLTAQSNTRRYKVAREGMTKITFKAAAKGFSYTQSFVVKREEKIFVLAE